MGNEQNKIKNKSTTKQKSDLFIMIMITDKIGWHKIVANKSKL